MGVVADSFLDSDSRLGVVSMLRWRVHALFGVYAIYRVVCVHGKRSHMWSML